MKKKYLLVLASVIIFSANQLKAQVYTAKVSKDSIAILSARMEALKASQKVQELKIDEGKEEDEVEKLRVKLLEANDKAKESAAKNSQHTEKLSGGGINAKETEKLAKRAKNDMQESQKALERYNKQIAKVEKIREQIRTEERKLDYKKPVIIFSYR